MTSGDPGSHRRSPRFAAWGCGALLAGCLLLVGCQAPAAGPRAGQPVPPTRAAGTAGSGRPVSIQVPAIGVDARVVPVGLGPNRSMEVPAVDRPVLRLITCGGCFDHATGHDRDNVIVYAGLTKP